MLGVASVGYATIEVRGAKLRKRSPDAASAGDGDTPRIATIAFCVLTVAFVSFAANALGLDENDRFRAPAEPLLPVLIAAAILRFTSRQKKVVLQKPPGIGSGRTT